MITKFQTTQEHNRRLSCGPMFGLYVDVDPRGGRNSGSGQPQLVVFVPAAFRRPGMARIVCSIRRYADRRDQVEKFVRAYADSEDEATLILRVIDDAVSAALGQPSTSRPIVQTPRAVSAPAEDSARFVLRLFGVEVVAFYFAGSRN
jgi:hypothetical protein